MNNISPKSKDLLVFLIRNDQGILVESVALDKAEEESTIIEVG